MKHDLFGKPVPTFPDRALADFLVNPEAGAKLRTVGQPPEMAPQRAYRRMMDQHDAEISARLLERFGQSAELALAKAARRHEWAGWHACRKRDERNLAAPADEGKAMEA